MTNVFQTQAFRKAPEAFQAKVREQGVALEAALVDKRITLDEVQQTIVPLFNDSEWSEPASKNEFLGFLVNVLREADPTADRDAQRALADMSASFARGNLRETAPLPDVSLKETDRGSLFQTELRELAASPLGKSLAEAVERRRDDEHNGVKVFHSYAELSDKVFREQRGETVKSPELHVAAPLKLEAPGMRNEVLYGNDQLWVPYYHESGDSRNGPFYRPFEKQDADELRERGVDAAKVIVAMTQTLKGLTAG